MVNPEISGVEYQQGELQGYEVKEYLLEKFNRTCIYCGKTGVPLEIEHIVPKSRNGSDRVSNLTISCHKCNQKKGNRTAEEFGHPEVNELAKKPLRATAFMNQIRWELVNRLESNYTFGAVTKYNRTRLGIDMSHVNDAFVIAGGTVQTRVRSCLGKEIRRNNRALQLNRKGFKPSIRRQRYGLQLNDTVRYNDMLYKVKGVNSYGKGAYLVDSFANVIHAATKNMELLVYGKGLKLI